MSRPIHPCPPSSQRFTLLHRSSRVRRAPRPKSSGRARPSTQRCDSGGGSGKEGKFRIGDLGGQGTIPWHTKIWTRPMILSVEVLQHGSGCRLGAEIRIFTRALTTCMICIFSNAFFIDTSCCKTRCSGGLPNTREPYFLDPMRAETVGVQDNGDVR